MRRQRGLVTAAATLALAALGVNSAATVLAQGSYLVTIVDATPGRCSVRTTAPACFSPSSATVTVDTTVEWYNRSSLQHTVTGTGWGSGTIGSNGIYKHTFGTAGSFPYHCTMHPTMTGTIYVYDPNASSSSDSQSTGGGTTSFSISSPQNQPFTSTTTSSASSTSTGATSATTTDTGDVALAGGDSGSDTVSFSTSSHASAPAAVLKEGGSGLSAALVAVLLLLLIGGASTAALVLTRPGRSPRH